MSNAAVRTLLVGFDDTQRKALSKTLRTSGLQVAYKKSPKEAESLCREAALILMAVPDGPKATAKMAEELRRFCGFRDVPILAMGDRSAQESLKAAVGSGATDQTTLPLEPAELAAKIRDLLEPAGGGKSPDVNLVNPFVGATVDVFKVMVGFEPVRRDVFLKKDYKMFGDVSGIMGLSGNAFGSVIVSMTENLARTTVARMTHVDEKDISSEDIRDGIGELVNIISGSAKAKLAETEYAFQISLPTVITGYGHEISHKKDTPCVGVVFQTGEEEFAVLVSLAPVDNG